MQASGEINEGQADAELLGKIKAALKHAIAALNDANGTRVSLGEFADAFDPNSRAAHRLLAAVVKDAIVSRSSGEFLSPRDGCGSPMHSTFRGGYSPATESGSWGVSSSFSVQNRRQSPANVDLDHVRNLMEAIEIVSPSMVGSDINLESPTIEARGGWSLSGHGEGVPAGAGPHGPGGTHGASTHAIRHRRASAQATPHGPGIPIARSARARKRSAQIDPVEFAEYAVAHMRPSPRLTQAGPSSLPRASALAGAHHPAHLYGAAHGALASHSMAHSMSEGGLRSALRARNELGRGNAHSGMGSGSSRSPKDPPIDDASSNGDLVT